MERTATPARAKAAGNSQASPPTATAPVVDFTEFDAARFYGKDGRSFVGTRPSKKAVKSLLRRIHDRTTPQWYPDNPSNTIVVISRLLRGWCGYFDQGPVMKTYDFIRVYVERRLRHWLVRRTVEKV